MPQTKEKLGQEEGKKKKKFREVRRKEEGAGITVVNVQVDSASVNDHLILMIIITL